MSTKWRRFEVMLPRQFNDGRDVPPEWISPLLARVIQTMPAPIRPPGFFIPTPKQLAAARNKRIPDVIATGLKILFVGINPGLYSAAIGHHFGRPGNRFWPALHRAGFTERELSPFEDRNLLDYGCGITNLAGRATASADELTVEELRASARRLQRAIRRYRPRIAAFVGVTAYRMAFDRRQAKIGLQEEGIGESALWVLPNPSGLNAHYQLADFVRMFGDLRRAANELG